MIGKIIGAVVGGKIAENTRGIGGTTGALLGAAAPVVLRRLSIPAMLVIGAGGYFAKKHFDKKDASGSNSDRSSKSSGAKGGTSKKTSATTGKSKSSKKKMPEPAQKTAPVATPPQPATA